MGQGDAPERIRRALAAAFDPVFYRTVYDDIARTGADPFRHYSETGWREGRDPAPWFSTAAYLAQRPDVAGGDPFAHYLERGWREGAEPVASRRRERFLARSGVPAPPVAGEVLAAPVAAADPDLPEGLTRQAARDLVAAAFDRDHYLSAYPDIAAAGADPLDHYLATGRREGRDPTPDFSAADYLEVNPDVAASG
ncbi:MAG: hypothetical protein ACKN9P_15310, partial [Phenylobacterium sp.]